MKIDLVFLVILGFMVLKTVCNNKTNTKEHMTVTSDMKAAINEIYNADVSAIQNLSAIATSLQAGGFTCAGKLTVTSDIVCSGGFTCAGNIKATGNITADGLIAATGNITADGFIAATGNLFGSGLVIGGKDVLGIINGRLNALEKHIVLDSNGNGIGQLLFNNGYIINSYNEELRISNKNNDVTFRFTSNWSENNHAYFEIFRGENQCLKFQIYPDGNTYMTNHRHPGGDWVN